MDTQENGKSFEEKTAQLSTLIPDKISVNPLDIFCPIEVDFSLSGIRYTIKPLPLRKLAMLQRLGKDLIKLSTDNDADIDTVMMSIAETICMIVDAPKEDAEFFYDNLTQPQLEWIFRTVTELSQGTNPKKG